MRSSATRACLSANTRASDLYPEIAGPDEVPSSQKGPSVTTVQPCLPLPETHPPHVLEQLIVERFTGDWWRRRVEEAHNPAPEPAAVTHARRMVLMRDVA